MNIKEKENFEKNQLRLEGIYNEIKALSGKRPDDAINLFKLQLINQMLLDAKEILKENNLPFKGFLEFDETNIPTNSDVVFILSGYLSAFEKLRLENISEAYGTWHWKLNGETSNIITSPPRKLTK